MYLTYIEYQDMGGTLDEHTFNDLERQAEMMVNWQTFNRLVGEEIIPEPVKNCMYILIDLVQTRQQVFLASSGNGDVEPQIASQSNDGVSISYNVLSAADLYKTAKSDIEDAIRTHLFGVRNSKGYRLTYRGLYPDE